jgi:hypothetical protein
MRIELHPMKALCEDFAVFYLFIDTADCIHPRCFSPWTVHVQYVYFYCYSHATAWITK